MYSLTQNSNFKRAPKLVEVKAAGWDEALDCHGFCWHVFDALRDGRRARLIRRPVV
jgi:hypothetical protein